MGGGSQVYPTKKGLMLDDVLTTLKHNYVDFANLLVHYKKICTVDSRTVSSSWGVYH